MSINVGLMETTERIGIRNFLELVEWIEDFSRFFNKRLVKATCKSEDITDMVVVKDKIIFRTTKRDYSFGLYDIDYVNEKCVKDKRRIFVRERNLTIRKVGEKRGVCFKFEFE